MNQDKGNQFNTFAGVFTPSILTILGAILFLRAGYVIGQAGIRGAMIILVAAELISLLTALSMSVIATNTPVRGGGAYFLISRALGSQFGGAIGLALFLAQALSVPFYILAFTNSLIVRFPTLTPWALAIALSVTLLLFLINLISTGAAIKSQYLVMTLLTLSIGSILVGAASRFSGELFQANLAPYNHEEAINFWRVFAIYFPAVTGILAGVNMSGDLKDPAKSLVRGTLAAIGVGFLVYGAQIIFCGGSQSRSQLIEAPFDTLLQQAWGGTWYLVLAGVFAATISSAIGSFLGAPRVLQALARDRIFRHLNIFARGSQAKDEPRIALILTLIVTLAVVVLAGGGSSMAAFDSIAKIVTMFFLCTYGMINLAAFVESFGGNPSFRPRFRYFHWIMSLLGFIGCITVMFLIHTLAALVALAIIGGIYLSISRREFQQAFGDARRGFQYTILVRSLRSLRGMKPHPKNWRPTFLVMLGSSQRQLTLLRYADWMEAERGLVTAAQVISGDLAQFACRVNGLRTAMESTFKENNLLVFPEIVFAEDIDEGMRMLVQAHSIGPLKPNTVLLGWSKSLERAIITYRHIRDISALGKSVVLVVDKGLPAPERSERRIDIWWRGQNNGSLMVTLVHLLTQNLPWRPCTVRILRHVRDEKGRPSSEEALEKLIQAARIQAFAQVVVSDSPFIEVFRRHSQYADAIFMGIHLPEEEEIPATYQSITTMLEGMPTTLLVHSSGEADLFA